MRAPEVAPQPQIAPDAGKLILSFGPRLAIKERSDFLTQAINQAKALRGNQVFKPDMSWDIDPLTLDNKTEHIFGPSLEEANNLNDPNYEANSLRQKAQDVLAHPVSQVALRTAAAVGIALVPLAIDLAHPGTTWAADNDPGSNLVPPDAPPLPDDETIKGPLQDTDTPVEIAAVPEAKLSSLALNVNYIVDDGVSNQDFFYAQEGVRIADWYFANNLGVYLPKPVRLHLVNSDASRSAAGVSAVGIYTKNDSWAPLTPFEKKREIVHELYHVEQIELSGISTDRGKGWLNEGSAEYISYMAMQEEGLITSEQMRACNLSRIPGPDQPVNIDDFDFYNINYNVSLLAVDFLVSKAGIDSLNNYFKLFPLYGWSAAFEAAFGMSPDTFYKQFDQYRKDVARSANPNACGFSQAT